MWYMALFTLLSRIQPETYEALQCLNQPFGPYRTFEKRKQANDDLIRAPDLLVIKA